MSKIIKSSYSTLTLFTDDVIKAIDKNELQRRREASRYGAKVMRQNVNKKSKSTPGGFPARLSGEVYKSIGWQLVKGENASMIGSKSFKSHLLEWGHGDGKERNKRPFVMPSLVQAEPEMVSIMSRRYW